MTDNTIILLKLIHHQKPAWHVPGGAPGETVEEELAVLPKKYQSVRVDNKQAVVANGA